MLNLALQFFAMKKIAIICLLSSLMITLSAQLPFLQKGKHWVSLREQIEWTPSQNGGPAWPNFVFSESWNQHTNGEDTIINQVAYWSLREDQTETYHGGFREVGSKVFYIPADSIREYLVYDFGANQGDTLKNVYMEMGGFSPMITDVVAGQVDSIEIGGQMHRTIQIDACKWIEGIGNTFGLLKECFPNVSEYRVQLVCMDYAGSRIYPYYESNSVCSNIYRGIEKNDPLSGLQIFPNPANSSITYTIPQNGGITSIKLLDVTGRELATYIELLSGKIDVSAVSPGVYQLQFHSANAPVETRKFLKQ